MLSQEQYWGIDRQYYLKASEVLEEARSLKDRYQHDLCVRRAQEAFELLSKAMLSYLGVEYRKKHEVSEALYEAVGVLQENGVSAQRAAQMVLRSKTLELWRELAFYGDERLKVARVFEEAEAELALEWADEMHTICSIVKDRVWERLVKRT